MERAREEGREGGKMLESNYDYLILYKMIDWGEGEGGREIVF